jgi:threonine dehydrogenase-like Zn-dependent dehydrogenase
LGHEFCGVVEEVGPAVRKVQKGKRYVASFQIACGDVRVQNMTLMNTF